MILPTLTESQKRVVRLMREGWELSYSFYVHGNQHINSTSLQKNGTGRGGEVEKIDTRILQTLQKKRIVEEDTEKTDWRTRVFKLTERGHLVDITEKEKKP